MFGLIERILSWFKLTYEEKINYADSFDEFLYGEVIDRRKE